MSVEYNRLITFSVQLTHVGGVLHLMILTHSAANTNEIKQNVISTSNAAEHFQKIHDLNIIYPVTTVYL